MKNMRCGDAERTTHSCARALGGGARPSSTVPIQHAHVHRSLIPLSGAACPDTSPGRVDAAQTAKHTQHLSPPGWAHGTCEARKLSDSAHNQRARSDPGLVDSI
ncbi:hypothetical protein HPB50_015318 [Hyalomma asiaticum]|uniref:Uncharacterized protein n=1 Tax=Hyalomma asiaticum TaxID=266040 RepID=A0ACB7TPL4_HYAAI|nr:hypothetical protein HPB50_015318 [Hyalomma asiaticum]